MKIQNKSFVRPVNYTGVITKLGPVHPEHDFDKLWTWINDREVNKFTTANYPVQFYAEKEYIESIHKRSSDVLFAIQTLDGDFIGMMGLHNIHLTNGTATTGALIGEAEYRGKHYGRDAKMHVLYHAFHILGLRKVFSKVKAFNKPSLKYLKETGYKIEGTLKEMFYFEGEYYDEVLLSITREDFLPLWEEYKKKLADSKPPSK